MKDLSKVKLIVWDLDETFWKGTISEESITPIPRNIQFVKDLTDCGIINSICSKNDEEVAVSRLKELDIWDYFVFASINWESKASRLKTMIDNMALRPANVLFLDDSPFNLHEAKHLIPELMIDLPTVIPKLVAQLKVMEKKDIAHKRLKQYQVLEEKKIASMEYSSNEDFLYSTNIQVEMCEECLPEIGRIHELMMRSNQLNFTKKRISMEELKFILNDTDYRCGYVKVKDNFGDYGLIGFYAVKGGVAEHFFFSCRTMGQHIEQWVYAQLGFPRLKVVGEVRTELNLEDSPKWINQQQATLRDTEVADEREKDMLHRMLVKGPCDLSRACMYLRGGGGGISTEMTYVRDGRGQTVFYHNHSAGIENIVNLTEKEKEELVAQCRYIDPEAFKTEMFSGKFSVVFLSTLMESNHGIYRQRNGKGLVVIGMYDRDVTLPSNRETGIQDGYLGYRFAPDELDAFSKEFEFIGHTTGESYTAFLDLIMEKLPQNTTLCLVLGATSKWGMALEKARMHEELNNAVKAYAKRNDRVRYIDVDECIENVTDFERPEYIDHYQARVYYKLAQAMLRCMIEVTGQVEGIKIVSTRVLWLDAKLNLIKEHFNKEGKLYQTLLLIYRKMTGRKAKLQ